jgi:recombination protein RecR
MKFSPLIDELVAALRCLPGVGAKSAQRMAFHLLERDRSGGEHLAETIQRAMKGVRHCERCRTLCETDLCSICANPIRRENQQLCIVGSPQDVLSIEQTAEYRGCYFVLKGHLSPIDGLGPDEIGLDKLAVLFDTDSLEEVILATNTTVEGEATAHFIAQMCQKRAIQVTRLARGVPAGGELEYIDGNTLTQAFSGRRQF